MNEKFLQDKTVLVTGGTGSFGQVFVRRILKGELGTPRKVIVFSRDEAKQHYMRLSYHHLSAATDEVIYKNFLQLLEFRIGDIRNYHDVLGALRGVDVVVNAAALKQVPTCEYFPAQAIQTNCLGASNIVQAIQEHVLPIDTVVGISTDKACKPINAMGMTKALQERIFISANVLAKKTRFIGVRYGNVMASRGSVIPLFHDQIRNGKAITITDDRMTRFLLSLDDAVDTVFAAFQRARPGEIFVPRAPAATVVNVAKVLIGDKNIPIEFTGIRPGEKIHEIMVSDEEAPRCYERGRHMAILPMLPELLSKESAAEGKPLEGEYSSAGSLLDLAGTRKLLETHRLLTVGAQNAEEHELIR